MDIAQDATVVTWVYCEDEGVAGMYSQVAGNPTSADFQAVYWRCAAVSMLSAAAALSGTTRVLYTNVEVLPNIDGVDLSDLFSSIGVIVRRVPLSRKLEGHDTPWRNQFYVFDVLEDVARSAGDNHAIVVIDGDCVWTGCGESFFGDIVNLGAVTYRIDYPVNAPINGLALEDAVAVRESMGLCSIGGEAAYYGGELIAVSGSVARQVVALFAGVWDGNLARQRVGQPYLTEEAHALSAIYDHLGLGNDVGNGYVKRMWTSLRCKTVTPTDEALLLWHLPAEKEYSFRELFIAAQRRGLFSSSSIGEDTVTQLIVSVLRKSWRLGPKRLRHDMTRALAAVRRHVSDGVRR